MEASPTTADIQAVVTALNGLTTAITARAAPPTSTDLKALTNALTTAVSARGRSNAALIAALGLLANPVPSHAST